MTVEESLHHSEFGIQNEEFAHEFQIPTSPFLIEQLSYSVVMFFVVKFCP